MTRLVISATLTTPGGPANSAHYFWLHRHILAGFAVIGGYKRPCQLSNRTAAVRHSRDHCLACPSVFGTEIAVFRVVVEKRTLGRFISERNKLISETGN